MRDEYNRLSNLGHIVLMPVFGVHQHDDDWYYKLHCSKIDMSDCVYIVDKDGYRGEGTKREIKYSESCGKPVHYFSEGALQ